MDRDTLISEALDVGMHAGKEGLSAAFRLCGNVTGKNLALAVACATMAHKIDGLRKLAGAQNDVHFNEIYDMTLSVLNRTQAELLNTIMTKPVAEAMKAAGVTEEDLRAVGVHL